MGLINPAIPTVGDNNSTEDPDIRNGMITIRDEINGNIDNANIKAAAQILPAKLQDQTAGKLLLANSSGVITATTLTGDVTSDSSGVTTIGASKITSAKILDGEIVNADINASAAIAYSKLNLASSVVNADISTVDGSKIVAASVADSKLTNPNNSTFKTIHTGSSIIGSSQTGLIYFMTRSNMSIGVTSSDAPMAFYIVSTDYSVGTLTTKLRLRAQQYTAATGPGAVTITVGLYAITAMSGSIITTSGSPVASTTIAFASTAASTLAQRVSSEINWPGDGYYIVGVTITGTTAASSAHTFTYELQTRNT